MKTALACVIVAACLGLASESRAQESEQRRLGDWIEEHFRVVGRSCFAGFRPARSNGTVVPEDIRNWQLLRDRWNESVTVYGNDSLDSIFSQVHRRVDGRYTGEPLYRIGASAERSSPIFYALQGNATRQHNCATMLAASANTELRLDLAQVKLALSANVDQNRAQTAYAYAGRMVSPLAIALGLNPTTPDVAGPIPRFRAFMSLWDWYRISPGMIDAADRRELEIYSQVDGAALYRTEGLTQNAILSGAVNVSSVVPFLSGRGGGSGSLRAGLEGANFEYAVAYWGLPTPARLPTASEVARRAAQLARFTPASSNPVGVESAAPFAYSLDLADLPSNYCRQDYWELAAQAGRAGSATATRVEVQEQRVAPGPSVCRFTFHFTPAAEAAASVSLAPAVKSVIRRPDGTTAELLLAPPPVSLPDFRSSVALRAATLARRIAVPADDAAAAPVIPMTFAVVERTTGRRASGVVSGSTHLTLSCGGQPARPMTLVGGVVRWSRTNEQASLAFDAGVPEDVSPPAGAPPVECSVNGRTLLMMEGGLPPLDTELPTSVFHLVREAPPQPA
ncbi:MAG: hypothetical protein H2038_08090 [Brevundimonas sp.]|uniref:hypothetical protein n=1 Tax=Brevundimonas sp. TaxID=1871086 RepID=UPI0017DBA493|nr:hypothetical protein [Brevundimonas sp.]MBA4804591.1 hypothetical protein [Brevundimonas sp.]